MQLDVKVAQLLCSRLCHDLVGSASAINAGLEMINEDPGDPAGPLDLMGNSAGQMTRRLAFFRAAFGLAEGARGPASVEEIRSLASDMMQGGKVALNWVDAETDDASRVLPAEIGKVCLNLILAGSECLPRGGGIDVHLTDIPEGIGIALESRGQSARISEDMAAALASNAGLGQLNAHNVHVYFAQLLARSVGGEIECQTDPSEESIQIAVLFPHR